MHLFIDLVLILSPAPDPSYVQLQPQSPVRHLPRLDWAGEVGNESHLERPEVFPEAPLTKT